MVLSPTTRHLVTAADLALLKPTAYFINTSRGPIVDEAALLDVLSAGKIAGAGLDVYDIEPLPLDHPLRKVPNVTLSPHNAYVSDDQYTVTLPTSVIVFAPLIRSIYPSYGGVRQSRMLRISLMVSHPPVF
jgi:phosphoglycerate dehydrogenase-like enzyme